MMSTYDVTTEHVATVNDVVYTLIHGSKPQPNTADRVLGMSTQSLFPADFWTEYNNNHNAIDRILNNNFAHFVLPQINNPQEKSKDFDGDPLGVATTASISNQLEERVVAPFMADRITALKRLWELEALDFNPVENYDRIESWSETRTGNEKNETQFQGGEKNIHTENAITDIETADIGQRKTNETETQGATVETRDLTNETITKNNQSMQEKNEGTSYNTNLYDTKTTTFDGAADTTTKTDKGTVKNDSVTNTNESTVNATIDTTTINRGEREHTDTRQYTDRIDTTLKTYNDVKDQHDGRIHGNIGVTTSTAMASEFDSYYIHYSFWEKLWKMFVSFSCSPTFSTDADDYAGTWV